ncbi:unnamed protein product [Ixodes pacificus]
MFESIKVFIFGSLVWLRVYHKHSLTRSVVSSFYACHSFFVTLREEILQFWLENNFWKLYIFIKHRIGICLFLEEKKKKPLPSSTYFFSKTRQVGVCDIVHPMQSASSSASCAGGCNDVGTPSSC